MPNVVNKRRGSFIGAGVEFKPGANEVSEDVLMRALSDASVASWFDKGILVLDDAGKVEAQAVSPSPAVEEVPAAAPAPIEDAPAMFVPEKVKAWGEKPRGKRKGG